MLSAEISANRLKAFENGGLKHDHLRPPKTPRILLHKSGATFASGTATPNLALIIRTKRAADW